jgi:transcriptional regulator with PAS, ATPase and Fis domain
VQAKLLRAVESKQVRPLGEARDVTVDVRLISAAQEPLRDAVADGRFRADLHARLEGLTITLPPLRDRREDVVPLFLKFMANKVPGGSPRMEARLIEALCLYDWPLNVRELLLLSIRMIGLYGGDGLLKRSHLPAHVRGVRSEKAAGSSKGARGVEKQIHRSTDDDAEFAALTEALRSQRTVAKAAEAIGVSRARAYRLISARKES